MIDLIERIEDWAYVRGLDDGDPSRQFLKLAEEVGELAAGMARSDTDEIEDAVGDIVVVLTILCYQLGISLPHSVSKVLDIIEKRTGTTVNGVFIKE